MPPRWWNPNVPPWLQEIILRCLEINADARYETAAQLRFALQHPDDVALTARAERRTRDGIATVFMRWLANRNALRIRAREAAASWIARRSSWAPSICRPKPRACAKRSPTRCAAC